jgi:hypothetical protein
MIERDQVWWLPLNAYRENARKRLAALRQAGVHVTFRGALRIYRMARSGVAFAQEGI